MAEKTCRTPLGRMLRLYMAHEEITTRELCKQIGFKNKSTITRLSQGLMPDAEGLVRIMSWLISRNLEER